MECVGSRRYVIAMVIAIGPCGGSLIAVRWLSYGVIYLSLCTHLVMVIAPTLCCCLSFNVAVLTPVDGNALLNVAGAIGYIAVWLSL